MHLPSASLCQTAGIASLMLGAAALPAAPATTTPPNIMLILIDDLGWGDIGVYGQKFIDTPNFDRLATQGMTLTHAYAPAPICSASRAASLTGRSPARLHFEFVTKPDGAKHPAGVVLNPPPYPRDLPLSEISLAEALAPAGYKTGYYGKWHLTQETGGKYLGHGAKFGPAQQGFAETSEERGSHPYNYPKGKKNRPGPGAFKPGEFAPDALTDQAIGFLRRHRDERFFLFLSYYYVHYPLHTRCKWLLDKYDARAKELGINLNEAQLTYAAFVETMDHLVGRALDALDQLGLAENTFVVLTSDNGGDPRVAWNGLRGSKWTLYEGGVRGPFIARWPGVIKAGSSSATPVTATDLMPTFCEAAGAEPPPVTLDGMSILPLLAGKTQTLARDTLTWHFPFYHPDHVNTRPCSSMRKGDMKLIYFYEDERAELYNLAEDPQESSDLAKTQPELAAKLRDELLSTLKAQGARFPTRKG
ncbi:sulfatase [Termitidicoccus mucosus]|uniref:Sulfatase N-terminal domain-containing protein n=1 Tax=Termitidicoccus mucosus TaxID=1184151 RepID=A0A178ILM4_9BACT|nr:hypothetical protein AW736_06445 [Opitutaceae bacterium TSB47]